MNRIEEVVAFVLGEREAPEDTPPPVPEASPDLPVTDNIHNIREWTNAITVPVPNSRDLDETAEIILSIFNPGRPDRGGFTLTRFSDSVIRVSPDFADQIIRSSSEWSKMQESNALFNKVVRLLALVFGMSLITGIWCLIYASGYLMWVLGLFGVMSLAASTIIIAGFVLFDVGEYS